jgi:large subunit ribosomal protein L4
MATLEVQSIEGAKAGDVALNDAVFGAEINERVVRIAYNQYMAAQRAGTQSTKTRAMVRGGGKKPWKQKGTGRARAGSNRSPIWRGGGITFGPSPRKYDYRINRKERRAAYVSLLSSHVAEKTLTVVENFELAEPKTRLFKEAVDKLGLADVRKLLVITAQTDETLLLASRNVQHVKVINSDSLNVYDLLAAYHVVVTKDAAERLGELFNTETSNKEDDA